MEEKDNTGTGMTSKFKLIQIICSFMHTKKTLKVTCGFTFSPTGKNKTTSSLQLKLKCSNGVTETIK
jgi:hypothetical protein